MINDVGSKVNIPGCTIQIFEDITGQLEQVEAEVIWTWTVTTAWKAQGYTPKMYDSNRFFTVTGLDYGVGKIRNIQKELNQLHARTFKKPLTKGKPSRPNGRNPPILTDDDIIAKAIGSNNGIKFETLWRGDW